MKRPLGAFITTCCGAEPWMRNTAPVRSSDSRTREWTLVYGPADPSLLPFEHIFSMGAGCHSLAALRFGCGGSHCSGSLLPGLLQPSGNISQPGLLSIHQDASAENPGHDRTPPSTEAPNRIIEARVSKVQEDRHPNRTDGHFSGDQINRQIDP